MPTYDFDYLETDEYAIETELDYADSVAEFAASLDWSAMERQGAIYVRPLAHASL